MASYTVLRLGKVKIRSDFKFKNDIKISASRVRYGVASVKYLYKIKNS